MPIFILAACFVSCSNKQKVPESLKDVKHYVATLDSTVTSMYGWEPRDSTYNSSIDTLVADMMDRYNESHPGEEKPSKNEHAIEQRAYDEARITWNEFKQLIDSDKYEEALDFYLGEGQDYIKKNSGDFLVFLKHSNQRFVFFSSVLRPLMAEYKGEEYATKEYQSLLQLEKALEDNTIAMSAESTGYIPEVYPYVIQDLGNTLVSTGNLDEAMNLFEDYIHAIVGLTGDALYANLCGTYYITNLYIQDGKPDWALGSWENFKEYLEKNRAYYDSEALEECFERIDEEVAKLSE